MDIWEIEKSFDYKIFFSNLTPHAVCYLVIRHSWKYCNRQSVKSCGQQKGVIIWDDALR